MDEKKKSSHCSFYSAALIWGSFPLKTFGAVCVFSVLLSFTDLEPLAGPCSAGAAALQHFSKPSEFERGQMWLLCHCCLAVGAPTLKKKKKN